MLFLDTELRRPVEEVGGWSAAKAGEAGLSAAITVDASGRVSIYDEHTVENLAVELEDAPTVVTFNGDSFDLPLLCGIAGYQIRPRFHIDLFKVISCGGRLGGWGLHDTCQRTLGYGKAPGQAGARAPALAQVGRWGELFNYCLEDVYLTKALYEFIVANGYVIGPGGEMKGISLPVREADSV